MRDWRKYVREHLPPLHLRPERELEIVDELAAQLESTYREAISAGDSEAAAARRAEQQIPDWKQTARELREATGAPERESWLTGISADVRFGMRLLMRQKGFAVTVILTLALGLGSCVAIYSLLEAVVLRSLPFRDPERLVVLWEANRKRGFADNVISPANFLDWQARSKSFEGMSAFTTTQRTLTGQGEPSELVLQVATPNHLNVLGIQPAIGRGFVAGEGRPDTAVVLLGHAAWRRHFGGDPNVSGRKILLGGSPYQVIGVLPEQYPVTGKPVDALVPMLLDPANDYRKTAGRYMLSVARLKAGVSVQQAQSELAGIAAQLEQEQPAFNTNWSAKVVRMGDEYSNRVRTALWILMVATALVVLIACANVANLLLAKAAAREREIAIRCSVGASGWRVVRQLFAESLALALASGAAGTAFAYGLIEVLKLFAPARIPRLESAGLNPKVLLFALALAMFTGLLFGLAPALGLARTNLVNTLKDGGRGVMGSLSGDRWRSMLVVTEIALALVLLVGSGLLIRTFLKLMAVDPGFESSQLLTMQIGLPTTRYQQPEQRTDFYSRLNERVRSLPGVTSVGSITWLPFDIGAGTGFRVAGRPEPAPGETPVVDVRPVHPGYFETMRIGLRAGRLFTDDDNRAKAPRRFVVNEALVRTQFPNQNPIGQKLIVGMGDDIPGEIIGVIADIRISGLSVRVRPQVYYPHAHLALNFSSIVIRSTGEPKQLVNAVVSEIRAIDPLLPATEVMTMDERVTAWLAPHRFITSLLTGFSAVALFLAMIGIYGLMSYMVEQRTHEIGVRLALGARPGQVRGRIIGRGLILSAAGTLIGALGSLLVLRLMSRLPFEVNVADPVSYAAGAAVLMITALLAVSIPASRATRVDPMVALRYE